MRYDEPEAVDFVRGDATGLAMPAHAEALRAAGAEFLTDAFRAFGALSSDNRVTRITRLEPFAGGNSGHKLLLSVEYATAEPGLHADLFVKFSRDFEDVFRDRRRHELESEVRLADLSRHPGFPVATPAAYFADFQAASGTGLLITQRIAFGEGGVEPLRRKCMDHELADPLAHYRATFAALARLAAAHHAGRLSPQLERLFPFDAAAVAAEHPISLDEAQLRERVARFAAFAEHCPQLLPAALAAPAFIARLKRDAVRILRHEAAVRRFLHADRDFIALCHWNTNIDNAWFWRDADGEMQCGLLDWGLVRQMNVAVGLWGGLCGAGPEIWARHLDELLAVFVDTLQAEGGPRLDPAELRLHLDLSVALLGLALMMDVPTLALSRLPEAAEASGPLDPILFRDEVVRGFLHVFTAFLDLWRRHDFGAALDVVLARAETRQI
ncbi:hypothetical protein [Phenylobacterium sp. LjRoot219]|uniref:hypothetical protein n=1 Tax=Phenylobacterium sp. LjRoot219 TaxID=3342283 RepID=UPI003F5093FD